MLTALRRRTVLAAILASPALLSLGGCGAPDGLGNVEDGTPECSIATVEIPTGARCGENECSLRCAARTVTFTTGNANVEDREVHWQTPTGEPPADGWPLVWMFQGSLFSAEYSWRAAVTSPFGAYHQTRTIQTLLEEGFAVLTPEVRGDGSTFWQTNLPQYSSSFTSSDDHALMETIFAAIADGTFGPVDASRMHAAGISSGGYMTSRMGITWPERFASLAIQSASYATCGGALCSVPEDLPVTHPPTLFLHGEADAIVPVSTMRAYATALEETGVPVEVVTDAEAGHRWLTVAPEAIPAWFERHP